MSVTSNLEMIIQDLGKSIEEYKVKLVIVDSIIALHRAEFIGRGTSAERQQRLLHGKSSIAIAPGELAGIGEGYVSTEAIIIFIQ